MVESSIGVSAVPLIAEESVLDPIVGVVTGIAYGGYKIYGKIRGRNNDDYSIDVLTTNEEQKEPTREDMMNSWRDIRSRDARRRQPVEPLPHELPPDDDLEVPEENYGSQHDIIPQANPPAQVIQEEETRDHLDLVPVDVEIPLEEEKRPEPEFVDNEEDFENREFGRPDPDPDEPPNGGDPNNNGDGGGNGDPNPNGNNQEPEEQKNNRGIQDSPLFNNAINQIINQIDSLKKEKDDEQNKNMTDAERQRYISDIEVEMRSQQQLIDLLTKFGENEIDVNKLNDELDEIQQSIQSEKIEEFTEDYVFSDIVETF